MILNPDPAHTFRICTFRGLRSVRPEPEILTWQALAERLTRHRRLQRQAGLWSPVHYHDGATRSAGGVAAIYALVLDVDDGLDPHAAAEAWRRAGLAFVIHTTYHHLLPKGDHPAVPRWRAVFPLAHPVSPHGWATTYARLADALVGPGNWDQACRDPSRIYYWPACPPDGPAPIAIAHEGAPLDPEHPPLPEPPPAVGDAARPGDDYSARGDHRGLLEAHGWEHVRDSGENEHWRRPGKTSRATSATWHRGRRLFYVFTTSTSLEPGRAYSLFALYAELEHHGDYHAAARALREQGYGDDTPRAAPAPASDDWRVQLTYRDDGSPHSSAANAAIILAHAEGWAGRLRYNTFRRRSEWVAPPPPVPGLPTPEGDLADHHAVYVQQALRLQWGLVVGRDAVFQALEVAARAHAYHPVRDYLDGLTWDGQPRVRRWLHLYLGASDDVTTQDMAAMWLISAVARIYEPGCQADHMLILEGPQGAGKSTAIRILGAPWYLAELGDVREKDATQSIQGKWLVEVAELDGFSRAATTRIKSFVTQTVDTYRPSYARLTIDSPRQCVFVGTTNESSYLRDSTGGRRFWPVRVGELRRDELARDRDQIWAEAVEMYRSGIPWWPSRDQEPYLRDAQEARYAPDPWEGPLAEWLDGRPTAVTVEEALEHLQVPTDRWDRSAAVRVGRILRRLGWRRVQRRAGGRRWREYLPPEEG